MEEKSSSSYHDVGTNPSKVSNHMDHFRKMMPSLVSARKKTRFVSLHFSLDREIKYMCPWQVRTTLKKFQLQSEIHGKYAVLKYPLKKFLAFPVRYVQ